MSPTMEDAIEKLKANEVEQAQQIMIRILNDDPKNDIAWKYLIESYRDLDFQIQLADEYYNLTGGSLKATRTQLRLCKLKNYRLQGLQEQGPKWMKRIPWRRPVLIWIMVGMVAFILLSNLILIGTSIGSAARAGGVQRDMERLTSNYSELLLKYSNLQAQYDSLLNNR
jgi:hypothetical protein